MTTTLYLPESELYASQIQSLHEEAFGPGRFARAAFRLREQGPHDPALSFVALAEDNHERMLGSVRQTWVTTGRGQPKGLLLGPLAVLPEMKNQGIGRALVNQCTDAAAKAGAAYVLLVGDAPYYGALNFLPVPRGSVSMPGPVDPARLLMHPLGAAELPDVSGLVTHVCMLKG